MHRLQELIGLAGFGIEAFGVLVIILGSAYTSFRFLKHLRLFSGEKAYKEYRRDLGRSIILGLEFLIAGDIIRTVIVSEALTSVGILVLVVFIRAFLSLTLHLEVEGRWPWQEAKKQGPDA